MPDQSQAVGETIGQRLKRLRLDRGMSQRELASPGVSYAYISRIEAGTRQPSVKALRKLAAKLGVTAAYLETGDNRTQTDDLLRDAMTRPAGCALSMSVVPNTVDLPASVFVVELRWHRDFGDRT